MITANQYAVSKQTIQNKHIKINLLNFQYQTVDELSGNCISGSINIDANADIRRTCNIDLVVTDSSFEVETGSKIWLDKYIQIFIGIESLLTDEIEWFNQGVYIIDAPSYTYDARTKQLSFAGLDLMAKLTGQRNGYLEGVSTIVPQGSNVRQAIIQAVSQLGGFTKYSVEQCLLRDDGTLQPVPNDIVMEQGSTIYDLLVALRDIMPYYEIFFDVDGVFHYSKIPTGDNESVIANDDIFTNILLSESIDVDFASVKNSIEVYGKDIEANYFATAVNITTDVEYPSFDINIDLVVPDYPSSSSPNYIYFAFTPTEDVTNKYAELTINGRMSLAAYDYTSGILAPNYDYTPLSLEAGKTYLATIRVPDPMSTGTLGMWWIYPYAQFHALVEDTNPDSPFYVGGSAGRIYQPLYGGEYDNLVGNELCYERAKYELYLATNMQNSITLQCVPTYYFDVNQLINHAIKDTREQLPYIIKSIGFGLGVSDTMTITAIRYYPLYPSL